MPPSPGFGWSSLCNEVRIPIEGEHFELEENITKEEISCERCRKRFDEGYVDTDDDSIAGVNGCLVRFGRDEEGVIVRAEQICQGMLHNSLQFEPNSFSGDLNEEIEDVCSACWETYVDHQWTPRDEGAQWRIEIRGDGSRSEYFAVSTEIIPYDRETGLRLISENGLKKELPREEIESITITPTQNINY